MSSTSTNVRFYLHDAERNSFAVAAELIVALIARGDITSIYVNIPQPRMAEAFRRLLREYEHTRDIADAVEVGPLLDASGYDALILFAGAEGASVEKFREVLLIGTFPEVGNELQLAAWRRLWYAAFDPDFAVFGERDNGHELRVAFFATTDCGQGGRQAQWARFA